MTWMLHTMTIHGALDWQITWLFGYNAMSMLELWKSIGNHNPSEGEILKQRSHCYVEMSRKYKSWVFSLEKNIESRRCFILRHRNLCSYAKPNYKAEMISSHTCNLCTLSRWPKAWRHLLTVVILQPTSPPQSMQLEETSISKTLGNGIH